MPNTNTAVITATPDTTTEAPPTSRFQLDRDVVVKLCAARGATNDRARARVMGINRSTMYGWIRGTYVPRLDLIDTVCGNLNVGRDVLFPGLNR